MLATTLFAATACGQKAEPLWPSGSMPWSVAGADNEEESYDKGDGCERLRRVSQPTLTIYRPQGALNLRTAVVVVPGGGYEHLSYQREGRDVCQALAKRGYTAALLKYRLPSDRTSPRKEEAPLSDAWQAIHILRTRAAELDIASDQVGLLGFSAGGHLCASAATLFTNNEQRPDFCLLLYPVVGLENGLTHQGTRESLIGGRPDQEALTQRFTAYRHIGPNTPPTFLLHAADDNAVTPLGTLRLAEELLKNNVRLELHLIPHGGHGFALGTSGPAEGWIDLADRWIRNEALPKG